MIVARVTLITCVLLLALAPAAEAAKRRVPQGFYGTTWGSDVASAAPDVQAGQWDLMARSGVESVRVVFEWAGAQREPGGPIDFSATDPVVARAASRQIRLVPVVLGPPVWAKVRPDGEGPADPFAYAAYVGALVERYGPGGTFWSEHPELPKRAIRAWQIWNEPHFANWYDRNGNRLSWARGYVRLLRAAHTAVKTSDRRATVVLAGLANRSWSHLSRLYRVGARGYFDIAAVHPYTRSPADVVRIIRLVRRTVRRAGGRPERRRQIWVTEMGWAAARGRTDDPLGATWVTTDEGMARNLSREYSLLARHRKSLLIGRAFWYTWASDYRVGGFLTIFRFSGLLRYQDGGFTRMPAWRAYTRSARRYQGCAKTSSGRCR
jgi:hypothetical protein